MTKDPEGKPKYSWDTSVFLAWIKEEKSAPLTDIELVAKEIDGNKAVLIVSAMVIPEVLEGKMSTPKHEKFMLFLERENVIVADVNVAIAKKAQKIRDVGAKETPAKKIKTTDATILATAILYGCDALHSLDDRGHLKLNGKAIVDGLKIVKPICLSGQRGLENF